MTFRPALLFLVLLVTSYRRLLVIVTGNPLLSSDSIRAKVEPRQCLSVGGR